jgi:hypothetical protein
MSQPLVGLGPVTHAGYVDDKAQLRDTLKHKRTDTGTRRFPWSLQ